MEVKLVLEEIGLSEKEIDVYLACLKLGSATVNTIADVSGVFRTYCYDILDSLEELGLVSKVTKEGVQYYDAVHPDRLNGLLREKQDKLQEVMPQLTTMMGAHTSKPEVRFFEGKEGIKHVHEDVLQSGPDEVLVLGPTAEPYQQLAWFLPKYIEQRVDAGIPARVLTERSEVSLEKTKAKDEEQLRETHFLPDDSYIPTLKYVYGDKVSIFSFEEQMLSILIQDTVVAEGERKNFDLIWKLVRKD